MRVHDSSPGGILALQTSLKAALAAREAPKNRMASALPTGRWYVNGIDDLEESERGKFVGTLHIRQDQLASLKNAARAWERVHGFPARPVSPERATSAGEVPERLAARARRPRKGATPATAGKAPLRIGLIVIPASEELSPR